MFKKGDMVECVDNNNNACLLTEGGIYEVRCDEEDECIRVPNACGSDVWFATTRFKKVTPPPIKAGDIVE